MEKYLVVYHLRTEWPLTGVEERSYAYFFKDVDAARKLLDHVTKFYDCTDAQVYEYTGIQYVQIERRHCDA